MKLFIRTKTDINGNFYYLQVDTENKKINLSYNGRAGNDEILIKISSRKELHKIQNQFENAGFITEYV